MSRVANSPVVIPGGVTVEVQGQNVAVKGPKGNSNLEVHGTVAVVMEDNHLKVSANTAEKKTVAMAGTMRSLLNNLITGVHEGFTKKLELRGVGYRAQAQGNKLNLTLGFSHPVVHDIPEGIKVETPSQTEVVVTGIDKQAVGQVAADIRSYRPPEPYKGKGVRYVDEYVLMKEAKKK
ncbi:50S ribosomal protein L6 [Chromatiales bacterium (ex Bugula neritina AB1)]|nr:50S ribosomal protein L6 [Chromatiales bacterium (ex Bugula neritina AB1)]